MEQYTKTVAVKLELDKQSIKKTKDAVESIAKDAKIDLLRKDASARAKDYAEMLKRMSKDTSSSKQERDRYAKEFKRLQRESRKEALRESSSDFGKGFKEGLFGEQKDFSWKNAGKEFAEALDTVLTKAKNALVDVLKDAWSELDSILNFSLLSNQNTRDLAFTYGFSGSQAYGYSKAMGIMGLQSEEDLMYLNPQQRTRFGELMTNFTEKYNSLYDQGFFEQYLDYQYEMSEFKEDLKLEVVQFFMDNKDLIKSGLKAIMMLADGALKMFSQIVSFLKGPNRTTSDKIAASTDIINNYSNSASNTNVKIDNTFNNVAKQDQGWLTNAGIQVAEQIVQAFR